MSEPALRRVVEAIRRAYLEGDAAVPGARLPSIRALERECGTSRSTVVHALAVLEAEGLVRCRRGAGCFVAERQPAASRALAPLLCVVEGPEAVVPLRDAAEGARDVCTEAGWRVVALVAGHGPVDLRDLAGCRALVLLGDAAVVPPEGAPCVRVGGAPSDVVLDERGAAATLTGWLLDAGRERIVCLASGNGGDAPPAVRERLAGVEEALGGRDGGARNVAVWWLRGATPLAAAGEVAAALRNQRKRDRPDAALALDDRGASALLAAILALGIEVPDDLDVATVGSADQVQPLAGAIHAAWPDGRAAGQAAARAALAQASGEAPPQAIIPYAVGRRVRRKEWVDGLLNATLARG